MTTFVRLELELELEGCSLFLLLLLDEAPAPTNSSERISEVVRGGAIVAARVVVGAETGNTLVWWVTMKRGERKGGDRDT